MLGGVGDIVLVVIAVCVGIGWLTSRVDDDEGSSTLTNDMSYDDDKDEGGFDGFL